eukprot:CAMPEP_0174719976 /NCGR_PEP_ID=MMETSP1094-20130205/32495_1 /TAXON_ID=156173 /ORGANISM="Chrysochromulina brevifilum, Strain UTEX LB 985" /LENGTH=81 /DNA_ID=CAMNT_0015920389 /DNA_START=711 /DNA_END=956 /DNA_ORIENTATION=-
MIFPDADFGRCFVVKPPHCAGTHMALLPTRRFEESLATLVDRAAVRAKGNDARVNGNATLACKPLLHAPRRYRKHIRCATL